MLSVSKSFPYKLVALQPAIADLNAFAVVPPPRDVAFFTDRIRPLIDLSSTLDPATFDPEAQIHKAIITTQVVRLRQIAYARCRASGTQDIHGLLARGIADGPLEGATLQEIHADIEPCRMTIRWDVPDARGTTVGGGALGGGDTQGQATGNATATLAGDGDLKLSRGASSRRCSVRRTSRRTMSSSKSWPAAT